MYYLLVSAYFGGCGVRNVGLIYLPEVEQKVIL